MGKPKAELLCSWVGSCIPPFYLCCHSGLFQAEHCFYLGYQKGALFLGSASRWHHPLHVCFLSAVCFIPKLFLSEISGESTIQQGFCSCRRKGAHVCGCSQACNHRWGEGETTRTTHPLSMVASVSLYLWYLPWYYYLCNMPCTSTAPYKYCNK